MGIALNRSRGKLLKVLLTSLVLHALLVYLIAQRHVFNPGVTFDDSTENTPIVPIKARLLFAPIRINNDIKDAQHPVRQQDKSPPVTKEDVSVGHITTQALPGSAPLSEPSFVPAPVPDNDEASDNKAPSAVHTLSVAQRAKRQLRGFEQRQLESLSQQGARNYQQQKTSPVLKGKKVNPFITEDERLQARTRVTVNCSGGANKAASLLSGLLGGTLRCSQPPPVKAFIQRRLNKTRHLPAKYGSGEQQK